MGSIHLDIDKLSPGFFMTGEALHKTGITVSTPMPTSHIGIDAVVKTCDGRFG
jgi:hypothetical protein